MDLIAHQFSIFMKKKQLHLPKARGLYDPNNEKENCGVGFIANPARQPVSLIWYIVLCKCVDASAWTVRISEPALENSSIYL